MKSDLKDSEYVCSLFSNSSAKSMWVCAHIYIHVYVYMYVKREGKSSKVLMTTESR